METVAVRMVFSSPVSKHGDLTLFLCTLSESWSSEDREIHRIFCCFCTDKGKLEDWSPPGGPLPWPPGPEGPSLNSISFATGPDGSAGERRQHSKSYFHFYFPYSGGALPGRVNSQNSCLGLDSHAETRLGAQKGSEDLARPRAGRWPVGAVISASGQSLCTFL